MSGGSRVPIPKNVQKTIQNIKEIAGNHSDEEVYAMLKECSMDPNETAQKLLLQDTFHEVKRKRDRKKENVTNREAAESRWRPSSQGRGSRGVRGSYSSRFISHDAGGGKNSNAGKDDPVNHGMDVGATIAASVVQEVENKALGSTSSLPPGITNGPSSIAKAAIAHGHASQVVIPEETLSSDVNRSASAETKSSSSVVGGAPRQPTPNTDQFVPPMTSTSVSGVYSSASDPVLVPSLDTRNSGVVGAIKREVGSQRTSFETNKVMPRGNPESSLSSSSISEKVSSEVGNPFLQGKIHGKSSSEASQLVTASHGGSASSRPSSNYSSRSQQVIGPQKVGPSKEWKPKSTNSNVTQPSGTIDATETTPASVEGNSRSVPPSSADALEQSTLKLQKKLEDLKFSDTHVIIPDHLQVPESERTGLSFGSFDASFGVRISSSNDQESDKSSTPLSESSQEIEEISEEPLSSNQSVSPAPEEGEYPNHPPSPTHVRENVSSSEPDASSTISPGSEYDQVKSETALPPVGPHFSVVHTAPNYSTFGLVPPMLGSQFAPFESSEPQARDATRIPSFVVQQPFDPSSSYYTQFYRPGADGDGRFSPFLAAPGPAAPAKYNGNIAVLSTQSAQSPQQEAGNSLVLSTAGPTPLVTQAAGAMQSSIAVTQQPVPVFRQPAGVHLSHYPPNYIQYYSPFYVPPPAIHHFLSNTAFPQQPPTGGIYPTPAGGAATAVKYSLSQYKPGTNTGNSAHIGMPTGYGPYTSAAAGYSPSPAVSSGNSTGSEDLSLSQYKENNMYMAGQQSEGSAVWIPAPGRDISGLQASSFYNLPPQGQHVTFAPTQAGHGAFAGIYHPAQTVTAATVHPLLQQSQTMAGAVEMVGPPAGVYQQPQRAQINWANNY